MVKTCPSVPESPVTGKSDSGGIYASKLGAFPGARIAGVDEAGAGALAGPVVAAAVVARDGAGLDAARDSKTLTPFARAVLADTVRNNAAAWSIAFVSHRVVDEINILNARLLAMEFAIKALGSSVSAAIVDGNRVPTHSPVPLAAIVGGDRFVFEIGAASILAKTARDALMRRAAAEYPGYGFERHFGYGTDEHVEAIRRLGPCAIHRLTFAPVRDRDYDLFPDFSPRR